MVLQQLDKIIRAMICHG